MGFGIVLSELENDVSARVRSHSTSMRKGTLRIRKRLQPS